MPMHMSIHMSMHISLHMSMHMPLHMSIHMSMHMPLHMSMHMPLHMSLHMSTHMPTHISMHMSTQIVANVCQIQRQCRGLVGIADGASSGMGMRPRARSSIRAASTRAFQRTGGARKKIKCTCLRMSIHTPAHMPVRHACTKCLHTMPAHMA